MSTILEQALDVRFFIFLCSNFAYVCSYLCSCVPKVKSIDMSWHDAKKVLRKDHRYELAELLERAEKQKLFDDHLISLGKKNKEVFYKLLDETVDISKSTRWKDVREAIKEDPRYIKLCGGDEVSVQNYHCFD